MRCFRAGLMVLGALVALALTSNAPVQAQDEVTSLMAPDTSVESSDFALTFVLESADVLAVSRVSSLLPLDEVTSTRDHATHWRLTVVQYDNPTDNASPQRLDRLLLRYTSLAL